MLGARYLVLLKCQNSPIISSKFKTTVSATFKKLNTDIKKSGLSLAHRAFKTAVEATHIPGLPEAQYVFLHASSEGSPGFVE